MTLFFLLSFWYVPIPPSCWMPCDRDSLFVYVFFYTSLVSFMSIKSNKSNMNNSFRININKIFMIKADIIKIFSMKVRIITTKCAIIRICINKHYIIIGEYSINFSSILFVTNQSGTSFNFDRQLSTALSQISWVLCHTINILV